MKKKVGMPPHRVEQTLLAGLVALVRVRLADPVGEDRQRVADRQRRVASRALPRGVEEAGDGQNIGFSSSTSARSYGVELEARLSMSRIHRSLAAFSFGGNLSLIQSRINTGMGTYRALQGQSPYVANLAVGYEHPKLGTRVDLLYNSFGRRIEEVGTGGAGNVYEEPFHRLDLAASHPLPHNARLKLAGTNLLDQRVVRSQDGVDIFAYKTGVTVVGSVELTLE